MSLCTQQLYNILILYYFILVMTTWNVLHICIYFAYQNDIIGLLLLCNVTTYRFLKCLTLIYSIYSVSMCSGFLIPLGSLSFSIWLYMMWILAQNYCYIFGYHTVKFGQNDLIFLVKKIFSRFIVTFIRCIVTFGKCIVTFIRCIVTFSGCIVTFGKFIVTFSRCIVTFDKCIVTLIRCIVTFDRCIITFGRFTVIFSRCIKTFIRCIVIFDRCIIYFSRFTVTFYRCIVILDR